MASCIYLDESGDLGWSFDKPYRQGGSSRYLTISAVCTPQNKRHLPKRIIKKLNKKYGWPANEEKKWSRMDIEQRKAFAQYADNLISRHSDIKYFSIVINKQKVQDHIRNDGNKLYNYAIGLMLLDYMAQYDKIVFMPDERTVKVASGNSLVDYLHTQLWFERNSRCTIEGNFCNSSDNTGVQFADMLSGVVQQNFEDGKTAPYEIVSQNVNLKKLYFGR